MIGKTTARQTSGVKTLNAGISAPPLNLETIIVTPFCVAERQSAGTTAMEMAYNTRAGICITNIYMKALWVRRGCRFLKQLGGLIERRKRCLLLFRVHTVNGTRSTLSGGTSASL